MMHDICSESKLVAVLSENKIPEIDIGNEGTLSKATRRNTLSVSTCVCAENLVCCRAARSSTKDSRTPSICVPCISLTHGLNTSASQPGWSSKHLFTRGRFELCLADVDVVNMLETNLCFQCLLPFPRFAGDSCR